MGGGRTRSRYDELTTPTSDAVEALLRYAKEGLMMTDGFGKKLPVDAKVSRSGKHPPATS